MLIHSGANKPEQARHVYVAQYEQAQYILGSRMLNFCTDIESYADSLLLSREW